MYVAPRRADVVPGGEMPAFARKHDRTHGIVLRRAHERIVERVGHLTVLRVVELWPVQRDPRHVVDHLVTDGFLRFVSDFHLFRLDQVVHVIS